MELLVFHTLVIAHIITGATGAIAFWVPVIGRKGGVNHRKWGQVFSLALLCTGFFAFAMSLLSLYDPMGTHPQLQGRFDAVFVRGFFGHLMLCASVLTVNLAWYGWMLVRHRGRQELNRTRWMYALQWLTLGASINCAGQGWAMGEKLLVGLAIVGVATALTNLHFLAKDRPTREDWLKEHVKSLVGAGISVYTAFMAFGSVRMLPELALNPLMWAIPLAVGLAIIIWHRFAIDRAARQRRGAMAQQAA
jgi:hypothetical protein